MAIQPRPSGKTSLMSSFYEQLVEHVFISEVLQEAWYGFGQAVEVLRSEIDASGYDVVFDCNGTVRHVQLKTSAVDSKTARQNVNIALAAKPSACVVWILRHEDAVTNRMKLSYLYFGGDPGEPLPSLENFKMGQNPRSKTVRAAIRVLPKSTFVAVATTRELVARLFGLEVE